MAFFDRNKSALAKLKTRDWTNEEQRKEVFREVLARTDLKIRDMLWTLTAPEPEVRQLGSMILPRFAGPGLAQTLFEDLAGKAPVQQRILIRHIARCDVSEVQTIAGRLLADADRLRKAMGIELVAALPVARALPLVRGLLRDMSPEVRLAGLSRLLEDPNALLDQALRNEVLAMSDDTDDRVRLAVLKAVVAAPVKDAAMMTVLIRCMKDDSYNVKQTAAQFLGERIRSGDANLEGLLIEMLSDGSTAVRSAVIKALLEAPDRRRVIRRYLAHTRTLAGWVRERALESLKAFSRDLVEPVIELMYDSDEEIRLLALGVGSSFEDPRCVPAIIRLLKDDDWWTRITAAETLGRIGDRRAVAPLIEVLRDEEARWAAIEALGQIRDPQAAGPIARFLKDPAPEIRLAAMEALADFPQSREVGLLIESMARRDESQPVRDRAVELIRRLEGRQNTGRDLQEIEAAARQHEGRGDGSALEHLMIEVRNRGGSDLHLSVGLPPIIRVHGELQRLEMPRLDAARIEGMLSSILNDRQKHTLQEKLQVDFCYAVPNVGRYRANVFVQRLGMGGIFRVIPNLIPTFQEIGLPSHLSDLVNYHQGLIVVAGPSGAGKSTTLAALVNLFNEQKRLHVITLEDPVEFVHPMKNCLVNQREVGKHTHSFAAALRGALREDPDVIVVGEMRDNETMRMALEASETGHLVIATVNTTSAPKTIDRLIESFPPAEQPQVRVALSESLKAVLCQNLLPRRDGKGRVALFEILMGTPSVRALIRDSKTYQLVSAMQIGRNQGMRTIDMSLQELVSANLVAPEVAYLRAHDKSVFETMVAPSLVRDAVV